MLLRRCIFESRRKLIVGWANRTFSTEINSDLGEFHKLDRKSGDQNCKSIYVANKDTADEIISLISKYHNPNVPFIEINPGPCVFTQQIAQILPISKLVLIEENSKFQAFQEDLSLSQSIPVDRIEARHWNTYQAAAKALADCAPKNWQDDSVAQVFGCFLSPGKLYYTAISNVIKQRGYMQKGRIDYFFTVYSREYLKMIATPNDDLRTYTSASCLFQIIFECELLGKLAPMGFAPNWRPKEHDQSAIKDEPCYFYLVRITPRRNLFTLCDQASLSKLSFFIKQCLFSRQRQIITLLDSWLPNFGIKLMLEKASSHPTTDELSVMDRKSVSSHLPAIDITTKSGSLTPIQLLALFNRFQDDPAYGTSCFHTHLDKYQGKSGRMFDRNKYKMTKPKYKQDNK